MPHKMNTRSCERVNGLAVVIRGYLSMISELAGDQWNEATSVARCGASHCRTPSTRSMGSTRPS